jgi:monovalent cation:H+ antiporter-2, CPA2 family
MLDGLRQRPRKAWVPQKEDVHVSRLVRCAAMPEMELILTLAGGLSAALVFGYLTQRLGLSPLVGYLLAGVVIGPYTPGFVANASLAEQLANFGVILLMFGVGLQFHVEELLSVRRVSLPGAVIASGTAFALGAAAARVFGYSTPASMVFGLSLAVASTVVLVRVLADHRELHTSAGHIAVGWLVVEDLFTVIVLVLLPTLFAGTLTPIELAQNVAITFLKVAGLVVFAAVVGRRAIPALLDRVAATRSRELFTLTVLVIALGIAIGATTLFGVSMALGAFLAGLVVARSEYSLRAATDALPMRDAFAVLFFVSIGMLINPEQLLEQPALVLAALAIVLIAKPLAAALVLLAMRYPLRTVLTVAVSLGQIGEFSFILIALGRDLGIVPASALNIVVAVSIISITLNPLTSRLVDPVERWIAARTRLWRRVLPGDDLDDVGAASSLDPRDRAVVVGYGPTGRTVTRLLRENGISPTVVELNIDTVRAMRQEGLSAVYGDARHPQTLISAGLRHAGTLIVSGADTGAPETIRSARELNDDVRIFVRAGYLRDVPALRAAGAQHVFSGEGEVALAMTEAVLQRLGATPDQIDRERQRVHEALFGSSAAPPARRETPTPV